MEPHKFLFPNFKRPKEKYIPNFSLVARKKGVIVALMDVMEKYSSYICAKREG